MRSEMIENCGKAIIIFVPRKFLPRDFQNSKQTCGNGSLCSLLDVSCHRLFSPSLLQGFLYRCPQPDKLALKDCYIACEFLLIMAQHGFFKKIALPLKPISSQNNGRRSVTSLDTQTRRVPGCSYRYFYSISPPDIADIRYWSWWYRAHFQGKICISPNSGKRNFVAKFKLGPDGPYQDTNS